MKTTLWALLALFTAVPFVSNAQSNTYPWPSTGAIGIGTASPSGKLDIENNANSSTVSYLRNTSSGTAACSQLIATDGTGNLQMGQASSGFTSNGLITANSAFVFSNGKSNGLRLFTIDNTNLTLGTNNAAAVTISSGGNVGIGTTSPTTLLHIGSSTTRGTVNVVGSTSDVPAFSLTDSRTSGRQFTIYNGVSALGNLDIYDQTASAYRFSITSAGKVGIGTTTPDQLLSVNGTIHSKEVLVDLTGLPDYVFKPAYHLPTLVEVEKYIAKNQHLPEIPSAQEVEQHGLKIGEMNKLLLKKVEELTLYLIEKDKQTDEQRLINQSLQQQLNIVTQQVKVVSHKHAVKH